MKKLLLFIVALVFTTLGCWAQTQVGFESGETNYVFATDGAATLIVSTEQAHMGVNSAKMALSDGSPGTDFAKITIDYSGLLKSTVASCWNYVPTQPRGDLAPYLYFILDADGSGTYNYPNDALVIQWMTTNSTTDAWFLNTLDQTSQVHVVGNRTGLGATEFSASNSLLMGTLADLCAKTFSGATKWGDLPLIKVRAGAGEWPGASSYYAYVDDITITMYFPPVLPVAIPTPTDNDFTVIQNAITSAAAGDIIDLQGTFDWTETNAYNSYIASTSGDIRGVEIPNVSNLTITSSTLDAQIIGPGDVNDGALIFSSCFYHKGTVALPGLTIEEIYFNNFEACITLSWDAFAGYNGTTIQNNTFTLAGDDGDATDWIQNIAVYMGMGTNQTIKNNSFLFKANGTRTQGYSGPAPGACFGFQSATNPNGYNGLDISNNSFEVLAGSIPANITYGIWENSHSDNNDQVIHLDGNEFKGRAGDDFDRAFILSSQSDLLTIDGNIFDLVDNIYYARSSSGVIATDEFTFTNSVCTNMGGSDGIFLQNVTETDVHVTLNWATTNSIDGETGIRGLNELSTQATHATRSLSAATDLNLVLAFGEMPVAGVDDNWGAPNRFTDPDGIGLGSGPLAFGFNTFDVIQNAINAVTNSTVYVAAGTYTEQVLINKENLTITGAGIGQTIIKSPATLTTSFGTKKAVVCAHTINNVNLNGLTIDGDGKGNANNQFVGLAFWNAGGTVNDVDVIGVRDTPFSGAQHGVAVYAYNDTGGPYTITIDEMNVNDFQKNAFALSGTGLTVDLDNINVTGAGPTSVTAQNGIQIGYGANGTIDNSTISGIAYTGSGWTASGLLIFNTIGVTVSNVDIDHSQTSVYIQDADASYNYGSISYPYGDGIYIYSTSAAKGENEKNLKPSMYEETIDSGGSKMTINVSIDNCVITGTSPIVEDSWGIGPLTNGGTNNTTITNCTISNWDYAIFAYQYSGGGTLNVTANGNDLSNNTYGFGTNITSKSVLNAENNYWGTIIGSEIANKVSGPIDYIPWCNSDFSICTYGAGGGPAPITTIPDIAIECAGDAIAVPVTVTNFNNVGAISLVLSYNFNNLSINPIPVPPGLPENWDIVFNPALSGAVYGLPSDGVITISYISNTGVNLADGETLFTMNFNYIGANSCPNGVVSDLTWSTFSGSCEYAPPGLNEDPYTASPFGNYFIDGSVGMEHTTVPAEVGGPVTSASTVECVTSAVEPTTLPDVEDVCGNPLTAAAAVKHSLFLNDFSTAVVISPTPASGVWYTDRYAPSGFESPVVFDGDNRLKHSINIADGANNRPSGYSSTFYNTQGRKYDLGPATDYIEVSLYIPSEWETTNKRMAGLWGTAFNASNGISGYPIVEFTSDNNNPRFQVYENGPWVSIGLPTSFAYDAWYTLKIKILPNGEFFYSAGDLTYITEAYSANESVRLGNVILQGHNYDPVDPNIGVTYDIYWDNFKWNDTYAEPTCEGLITYTFNYEDCSGLVFPWMYTYIVERSTLPAEVGTAVEIASTIECAVAAVTPTLPVIEDVCGNVLSPVGPDMGGTYVDCEGTITYTYTYTDCADLEFEWVYTYTVDRTTLPTNPSDDGSTVYDIDDAVPPTIPVVTDVCGATLPGVLLSVIDSSDPFTYPGARVYTYTFTDCSGLQSDWVYTYTVPGVGVSGVVTYYKTGDPPLNLINVTYTQGTIVKTAATDINGAYSLSNLAPGNYDVTFSTGKDVGGINSTDAAQVNYWWAYQTEIEIVRWLAGNVREPIPPDQNAFKILSNDAGLIQQYFLTQGNPTPAFYSRWSFWSVDETISANPGEDLGDPQVTITGSGPAIAQNFYGLVTGDFNRSFTPGDDGKSGSESLTLNYGQTVEVGEDAFELPLVAAMDMQVGAISLILNFPSDVITLNEVYLSNDQNTPVLFDVTGNELRISWYSPEPLSLQAGQRLVTLVLEATGSSGEPIYFSLASDPLNELADDSFEVISNAALTVDVIKTSALGTGGISLSEKLTFTNHPNPFIGTTNFVYTIPADGKVLLEVYDIVGNKVMVAVDETQSTGEYLLKVDRNTLQPGVYMATLRLESAGTVMMHTIKIISK